VAAEVITMLSKDRAAVEKLRAAVATRQAAQSQKPTVEQVKYIVEELRLCRPLALTASRLGLATAAESEKFVLDVVATFGTWLSHSLGRADVEVVYEDHEAQPRLFHMIDEDDGGVKIPAGYEPWSAHQRDVVRALSAILHHNPSDEVIARYVSRTYGARQAVLSYPLVSGVWGFAVRNRLATIHLVSADLVFQAQTVEAFDLLDIARADAVAAIVRLVSEELEPGEALAEAEKAYWLAESELRAVIGALELVNAGKAPNQVVERAIGTLRRHVNAAPGRYLPSEVRDLTLGQVQRICVANGLKVASETRSEEADIRTTLKEMGLSADADRLVPQALRCAEQGDLDSFWAIMQSRVEGDLTWGEQLNELVQA
jgi:hypothetical protein